MHFYAQHAPESAIQWTEPPTDIRKAVGNEGKHHLAAEVMFDAIALNPSTEMAVEGLLLESLKRSEAVSN